MRKILLAFAALSAIGLGGCAKDLAELKAAYNYATDTTVTPQAAIIAINTFAPIEATARNYLVYCKGAGNVPQVCAASNRRVVIKAVRAGHAAVLSLSAAQSNGTPLAASIYNVLLAAISSLNTVPIAQVGS